LSINTGYETKEDVTIDIDNKGRTREYKNGNTCLVCPLSNSLPTLEEPDRRRLH
jgi:hypothetical protein